MAAGVAGKWSSAVVADVGSSGQTGLIVVRRRFAGVATLNGIPRRGVTTDTGRDVVVVFVVVAAVVVGRTATAVVVVAVLVVLVTGVVVVSADVG